MQKKIHIKQTAWLAIPLIITQVGYIITGIVDNMFLGKFFGETEQAAGIVANQFFLLLLVFEIGISYGITPLVAGAHVKKNQLEKAFLLKNSLLLVSIISVLLFIFIYFSVNLLQYMQQPLDVVVLAKPYLKVLALSIIPISFFFVCKQYCEGLGKTKPSMYISIIGNILNIILNYLLITGKLYFPNLGYMGTVWATFYSRCFMGLFFLLLVFYSKELSPSTDLFKKAKINFNHLKKIFYIGMGSAFQFLFEMAAFVICAFMCGSFGKQSIDAHGIAISYASGTYMFASGISGAATIRVGQFYAVNDLKNTKLAGNSAFILVAITMAFFGLIFLCFHNILPTAFTASNEIAKISSSLLLIAALFQLFDGIQVTGLGVLRGMEDVQYPTIITLIGYWVIALPLAYLLAFKTELKVFGIWLALSFGLIFVALAMFLRFRKITSKKNPHQETVRIL